VSAQLDNSYPDLLVLLYPQTVTKVLLLLNVLHVLHHSQFNQVDHVHIHAQPHNT